MYTQVPTRVFRDFYTCVSGYYRKSLADRNRTQIKIIAIELSQYSISLLKTPALDFLLYYFDVTWRTLEDSLNRIARISALARSESVRSIRRLRVPKSRQFYFKT